MSSKAAAIIIAVVVAIAIIAGIILYGYIASYQNISGNKKSLKTYTITIVKGEITVAPLSYKAFYFSVPEGAIDAHVVGYFRASGGWGNDIKVYIMDDLAFTNWKNGHEVSYNYYSGQLTADDFNVPLTSGKTYYLVLDNQFSLISSKNVDIEATLIYKL